MASTRQVDFDPFAGNLKPVDFDPFTEMAPAPPAGSFYSLGAPSGVPGGDLAVRKMDEDKRRRAQLSAFLGEKYDPEGNFGGSIRDFLSQADIARNPSFEDKRAKFLAKYPKGEFKSFNTDFGPTILARKNDKDKYRELGGLPEVLGVMVSEPMALGVGASLIAPASIPASMALTGLGTAAGALTQQSIEKKRGYGQLDPLEAAKEGGLAALADVATRGILRASGFRPGTAATREAEEAAQAARDEGLPPLVLGQISSSPFTRGMFRQTATVSDRPARVISNQERALLEKVQGEIDRGLSLGGASEAELHTIIQAQTRELASLSQLGTLGRAEAGEALQKGVMRYKEATSRLADRYYNEAAHNADDVFFDLRNAKRAASEITEGIKGMPEGGRDIMPRQYGDLQTPAIQGVQLAETPRGQFKTAVKALTDVESNLQAFNDKNAYEQLKVLRTRFFDMKNSDDPVVSRNASRIWHELTNAMDNPTRYAAKEQSLGIEEASPMLSAATTARNNAFVDAHKRARDVWRWRETNLEKRWAETALNTESPEKIAARYFSPGNASALQGIKDIIPLPRWNEFRTAFSTDVMNAKTAKSGLSRLDNFASTDEKGLRLLMTPTEEKATRRYLTRRAQFEQSPLAKVLDNNMRESERAVELIKNGTAADADDLVRLAGGKSSATAAALKAGVYKDILDGSIGVTSGGREIIDSTKLVTHIAKWKETGKLDSIFTDADWTRINNIQKYAAPMGETADIGGGMMAGSLRQKAIEAPGRATVYGDVKGLVKGLFLPLFSNRTAAYLLSRPAAYQSLRQASFNRLPAANVGLTILEYELGKDASQRRVETNNREQPNLPGIAIPDISGITDIDEGRRRRAAIRFGMGR